MHSPNPQSGSRERSLTTVVRRGNQYPKSARARKGCKRRFKRTTLAPGTTSPTPQTRQRGVGLSAEETVQGHFSLQPATATTLGLPRPEAAPAPRVSLPARSSRARIPQRAAQVALQSPPPRFPAGLIPPGVPLGCSSLVLIKPEWPWASGLSSWRQRQGEKGEKKRPEGPHTALPSSPWGEGERAGALDADPTCDPAEAP